MRQPGLTLTPRLVLSGIALLTLWRVAMLWANRTDLWVDESQYWLWGQSFSFGAFSKPPLIGWLIGLVTSAAGDSTFGVRLAAPLLHGATAGVILVLARRLADDRVAGLAALVYVTMPAATLGSLLISTDTPMLLAIAVAFLLQHRLATAPHPGVAALLGLTLGLGFLSKHAMLFAMAGMAGAALASADWRIARRDLGVAAAVALAVIAPNLWWIASSGFVTLRHLAESGAARDPGLHPAGSLRFVAEQFAVVGPVAFAAFLAAAPRAKGAMRGLAVAAGVILAIVVVQALAARALANWAVGFTVAGSILAATWLAPRPRWTAVSLAIGLAIAILLPVLTVFGTSWRVPASLDPERPLILARYLGRAEVSDRAMRFALEHGATSILAADRDLLADLSWQARDTSLRIVATPHDGPARHHWDLAFPYDASRDSQPVLLRRGPPTGCESGPADSWTAGPGFAEGETFSITTVSPSCLGVLVHD